MKPQEVKNAENEGKKVLRQGEWFFVRCDDQEACKVRTKGLEEKDYILKGVNGEDRKSTRLNSSHANISYAVFCLKKKKSYTKRSNSSTLEHRMEMNATRNLAR